MVCNIFPVNILGPFVAVTQKVYKGSQVFQNLFSKLSETVRCRASCTNKLSRKYCALGSFSFAKVLQVCHFSGIFIIWCSDMVWARKGAGVKDSSPAWSNKRNWYIFCWVSTLLVTMVLILDGSSDHVAHSCRKIGLFRKQNQICHFSLYNQMP